MSCCSERDQLEERRVGRLVGYRWSVRALEEGLHQLCTGGGGKRQCVHQVDLTRARTLLYLRSTQGGWTCQTCCRGTRGVSQTGPGGPVLSSGWGRAAALLQGRERNTQVVNNEG